MSENRSAGIISYNTNYQEPKRVLSQKIYENSCAVIPGGVNSPVRSFPGLKQVPLIAARGEKDCIWDVDGNCFIDFCGSWGALIHGHVEPSIAAVAQQRIARGSTFGIATEEEEMLARKIVSLIPSLEKIRFVSSGTEATMSAIRLARAYTGRDLIIKFNGHYHGHADPFLVQAGSGVTELQASSSSGVPEDLIKNTLSIPFNQFDVIRELFFQRGSKIAAVIVEPIAANMGVVAPLPGFLEMLRDITLQCGSLLIFDEVITGFRVGLQGAQGRFNLLPDLSCFGKIIGGGFPAAAFGGKREIMDLLAPLGGVYQAGTLSGNPVAMVSGLKAIELLEKPGFFEMLKEKTEWFLHPIEEIIEKRKIPACIQKCGSMFTLFFGTTHVNSFEEAKKRVNPALFVEFFHALFTHGIYWVPSQYEANFISSAHSDEHLLYAQHKILQFLEEHV